MEGGWYGDRNPLQQNRQIPSINPRRRGVLGLSPHSYRIQEFVVCWLFFSLAFVSLVIVILAGVLTCGACECVSDWASTAARRVAPKVELVPRELQLKSL